MWRTFSFFIQPRQLSASAPPCPSEAKELPPRQLVAQPKPRSSVEEASAKADEAVDEEGLLADKPHRETSFGAVACMALMKRNEPILSRALGQPEGSWRDAPARGQHPCS